MKFRLLAISLFSLVLSTAHATKKADTSTTQSMRAFLEGKRVSPGKRSFLKKSIPAAKTPTITRENIQTPPRFRNRFAPSVLYENPSVRRSPRIAARNRVAAPSFTIYESPIATATADVSIQPAEESPYKIVQFSIHPSTPIETASAIQEGSGENPAGPRRLDFQFLETAEEPVHLDLRWVTVRRG